MKPPAIILAAGAARRFGAPKQVCRYDGTPLVVRAIRTAKRADLRPVVVLGAHRHDVDAVVAPDVDRIYNPAWSEGMATSIRRGVEYVLTAYKPAPDRLFVCACDQPKITPAALRRLRRRCSQSDAAAAAYDGIVGIPACMSTSVFDELLALSGDSGARDLLRGPAFDVQSVPIPAAAFDIDTPDELLETSARQLDRRSP